MKRRFSLNLKSCTFQDETIPSLLHSQVKNMQLEIAERSFVPSNKRFFKTPASFLEWQDLNWVDDIEAQK